MRGFKQRVSDPQEYLVCWAPHLKLAKELGVLDRSVFFPYGIIEGEPSFPLTNINFRTIRSALEYASKSPGLEGTMANSQTFLEQLPGTGGLAGDDRGVVVGVDEYRIPAGKSKVQRVVELLTVEDDLGAVAPRSLLLHDGRGLGHDDGGLLPPCQFHLGTIGEARGIEIDPANDQNLYVADMMGGVWVSNDAGSSWRQENSGLSSTSMTSVKMRGDYIYASTQGSGVYAGVINKDRSIVWDPGRSNKPKAQSKKFNLKSIRPIRGECMPVPILAVCCGPMMAEPLV
jgi:hypothetical protein